MPKDEDKSVMTDVPDEKLEDALRVFVNSGYEKVIVELQDKKKRLFKVTAE